MSAVGYHIPSVNCKAEIIPEQVFDGAFAFALPEGSPFKPIFDEQ